MKRNVSEINKFQHMASHHLQGLHRLTRTDMHESVIGFTKLSSGVDIGELSFLEK